MCLIVEVRVNGQLVDCAWDVDELSKAIGCEAGQLFDEDGAPYEPGFCLCGFDINRAASDFGYTIDWEPEFGQVGLRKEAA